MPRLSLARLAPRRTLHLPSRTVRLRLTLLYSGLFLASGVALLADYLPALPQQHRGRPDRPDRTAWIGIRAQQRCAADTRTSIRQVRHMYAGASNATRHGLHQGLIQSGIAWRS